MVGAPDSSVTENPLPDFLETPFLLRRYARPENPTPELPQSESVLRFAAITLPFPLV